MNPFSCVKQHRCCECIACIRKISHAAIAGRYGPDAGDAYSLGIVPARLCRQEPPFFHTDLAAVAVFHADQDSSVAVLNLQADISPLFFRPKGGGRVFPQVAENPRQIAAAGSGVFRKRRHEFYVDPRLPGQRFIAAA